MDYLELGYLPNIWGFSRDLSVIIIIIIIIAMLPGTWSVPQPGTEPRHNSEIPES